MKLSQKVGCAVLVLIALLSLSCSAMAVVKTLHAESGEFNIFGYVSYHGTMSLDELMAPDPAEAFDMEMGGML